VVLCSLWCGGAAWWSWANSAHSVALFSDEERATVGFTYKCNGKEAAIRTGLKFVDVSWRQIVQRVEAVAGPAPAEVFVYCWRGGSRSNSVASLLSDLGYTCSLLEGGYKGFRGWAHAIFDQHPLKLVVLR
jgi:tRNA 2-selenouridine synthase